MHVPLRPEDDFDAVRGFARDVAGVLTSRHPDDLTMEQRKENRGRRLYLDLMRDACAQMVVAPYSAWPPRGAGWPPPDRRQRPSAEPLNWPRGGAGLVRVGRLAYREASRPTCTRGVAGDRR